MFMLCFGDVVFALNKPLNVNSIGLVCVFYRGFARLVSLANRIKAASDLEPYKADKTQ